MLSEAGFAQSARLPEALKRFPVARLVSSPQRRAVQTAEPLAGALGLSVEVDDRLAEYDRDMTHYVPIEEIAAENPEELARLAGGHLPSGVDEDEFSGRIGAAFAELIADGNHEDTVAVFSHGGVINVALHQILKTERLLSFHIDYASVTRVLASRSGRLSVASVNSTEHVWDLLPRNARW